MGLHGNMQHTLQSVEDYFQQILDGEFLSNEIKQKSGVAQGDKLSPLLFSLFIADSYFELKCKALDVIFYADDLLLGSHSQCQLQQNLNNLNTYCSRNYLKIIVNKTKCIKFRRGGRLVVDEKFYISKRENEFTITFWLSRFNFFKHVISQSSSKPSNEQSLLVSSFNKPTSKSTEGQLQLSTTTLQFNCFSSLNLRIKDVRQGTF